MLSILGAFDRVHQRLSLSDVARRTGIPLATVHRLLGELEGWGALTRDRDGRYQVGLRLWEVGSLAAPLATVRVAALPHMQQLGELTREDVCLVVRDGSDAVVVEYLSARPDPADVSLRWLRRPLTQSAAGLALLAHQDGLDPGLRDRLAEIRRRGFAVLPDQQAPELRAIAAPVTCGSAVAIAAVGLCGLPADRVMRWRQDLRATGLRVQRALLRGEGRQTGPGPAADEGVPVRT